MPLPTSGDLRLSQVATEFGKPLPARLSDMYGLGGVVLSGVLRLSDFRGLSDAPAEDYTWVGIVTIKPEQASGNTDVYGYSDGGGYGTRIANQNYSDFIALTANVTSNTAKFDAVGTSGIVINDPIAQNLTVGGTVYDAQDVDRVEYRVYGGSAGELSGVMNGSVVAGGKYGSAWVYRVTSPSTGPLSFIPRIGELYKYAADRNANVEFKTIIP